MSEQRCGWCEGCRWAGPCLTYRQTPDLGDSAGGFDLSRHAQTPQDASVRPAQLPAASSDRGEAPGVPQALVLREAEAIAAAADRPTWSPAPTGQYQPPPMAYRKREQVKDREGMELFIRFSERLLELRRGKRP